MKLIRLTDDRFVLDAGPDVRAEQVEALGAYWKDWWEKNPGVTPEMMVLGGIEIELTYEDRREPDIEVRLKAIELSLADIWKHVHITGLVPSGQPRPPRWEG